MCAVRDGATSTSGESSGLFVTPTSSSHEDEGPTTQPPALNAVNFDDDDELYRCTPDPNRRATSRSSAAILRETYLAARRRRITSQTPSPQSQQSRSITGRRGPFREDSSSSVPSASRPSTKHSGNEHEAHGESTTQENLVIPLTSRHNPFYSSSHQEQNVPTTRRTKHHHPRRQSSAETNPIRSPTSLVRPGNGHNSSQDPPRRHLPLRQNSRPASPSRARSETGSSFPGFVQEVSDRTPELEDTEMVDATASQTEERREIPSSSPLSSLRSTPEIQERDWEIVRLEATRVKDCVRERKIAWRGTRHSSAIMRMRPGGEVVLNVAGVRWGGMREQTVEPGEVDNDGMVRVYWATTWHPDWDLPKSLVAGWEREYGEDEVSKEDKQQPRWWLWPEQTEDCLPSEPEPDPGERELMPLTDDETFTLEPGKDYTISFLEERRAALSLPEPDHAIPESTIIRFLNMHVRNRLRVVDSFEEHAFRSNTLFVRTSLIYIFGTAMIRPCSHCRDGGGPYPRCVIWLNELGGACCNCAFSRRGVGCEYHFAVRWFKASALAADGDAVMVDEDSDPSPPSDYPSIDPSNEPTSTPPSSDPDNVESRDAQHSGQIISVRHDMPDFGHDGDPDKEQRQRSSSPAGRQHHQHTQARPIGKLKASDGPSRKTTPSRTRSDSTTSIKSEQFESSPSGSSTFHHPGCPAPPAPCRDPICGQNISSNPTHHTPVFRGDSFRKGQATDDQVNFILSCCTCTNTQALQQAWEEFRGREERNGVSQSLSRYESRERYFSSDCWRVLNQLVGWCPEKWRFEGEIDLTDD
ncbi:uncharacterized protein CLAFUR5_05266 [Fulvia fulva]|uniref:Uncharacterized protein n=1 Tax=Passalora fulva TaxID=5499 RepID=A0A9Q8P7K5_PASFU|nr:uncharacterized protein CLAFUR5_05266 [Fulvia fulva]KAK4616393.1 hypothetical protein CLAFUR0_10585 [Fulvia fulva]UJO16214.1 hypothetical protein CLAFUR5_05266 [Fulvia fulva]